MKNKKKTNPLSDIETVNEMMNQFLVQTGGLMNVNSLFETIFGCVNNGPKTPPTGDDLKNGFTLKWIVEEEKGESVRERIKKHRCRGNYGHLCKDGVQICDSVFRVGGLCGGFKDGYCSLILYIPNDSEEGYDSGTHVIVDETGKVCLKAENGLNHPYHFNGVVASLEKKYYNLKTGEVILDGSYKTGGYISERSVKSDHYVFLEGCSIEKTPSHNRKNIVYQIEFSTGKLTIIE